MNTSPVPAASVSVLVNQHVSSLQGIRPPRINQAMYPRIQQLDDYSTLTVISGASRRVLVT